MKNLKTIFALFVSLLIFSSSFSTSVRLMRLGYGLNRMETASSIHHSAAFKNFRYASAYYDEDKCPRYRGMTIAGAVVLGAGLTAFSGGVAMIVIGVKDYKNNSSGTRNALFIAGGYVLAVFGVVMTGAGTAVLAIGATKMRKYCRKGESMYFIPHANGLSFAYNFGGSR